MKREKQILFSFFLFLSFVVLPTSAFCDSVLLQEGIDLYKQEKFEESVETLTKEREQNPKSSSAAFFLGLAYKQMGQYKKATKNLRDAVTLTPRIKDALVELVEVLYRRPTEKNIEEAFDWIDLAEEENIFPAKIAFLKGLILQHQGKNTEAIEAFNTAKSLDPSLSQSAEFQTAISYLKDKDLHKAKESFQAAIQFNPQSDLGGFARQYHDLVEKRIELEKPVRLTLGLYQQYDSNVVLSPVDSGAAPNITDEESWVTNTTFRLDYVPTLKGPWLFNAQYAAFASFHEDFATSHDVISNNFYAAPGYNFGRYALNFAANYNNVLVRDPNQEKYLDYFSAGPLLRMLIKKDQLLELFASYDLKEYADPPINNDPEDRDSEGFRSYISWIWTFKKGAFFNLKYEYTNSGADGQNWGHQGHNFTLNTAIPIREDLKFQASAQVFKQNYENIHTTFGVKRDDDKYQGTLGLTWEFRKNTNLIVQFTPVRQESNISIYDYKREMYTAGIEYRF